MTTEPYAHAERGFWVVDNGSSHRGRVSIDRMTAAWPTARLVHLPVHASWLDQIEIFFSILQRKVLTPNDLTDPDALATRVLAFQDRYNATASRSTGNSPAPTSTDYSNASPPTGQRPPRPRQWLLDDTTMYLCVRRQARHHRERLAWSRPARCPSTTCSRSRCPLSPASMPSSPTPLAPTGTRLRCARLRRAVALANPADAAQDERPTTVRKDPG